VAVGFRGQAEQTGRAGGRRRRPGGDTTRETKPKSATWPSCKAKFYRAALIATARHLAAPAGARCALSLRSVSSTPAACRSWDERCRDRGQLSTCSGVERRHRVGVEQVASGHHRTCTAAWSTSDGTCCVVLLTNRVGTLHILLATRINLLLTRRGPTIATERGELSTFSLRCVRASEKRGARARSLTIVKLSKASPSQRRCQALCALSLSKAVSNTVAGSASRIRGNRWARFKDRNASAQPRDSRAAWLLGRTIRSWPSCESSAVRSDGRFGQASSCEPVS
jgi:hypothetical protein